MRHRGQRQKYLELQADRVEAVLGVHKAPARVIGGTLGLSTVRFDVQPAPHIRYAQIERLAADLAIALRVPDVTVSRGAAGVALEFPRDDPQAFSLTDIAREYAPLPAISTISPGRA